MGTFEAKKAPRGNPEAAASKRWSVSKASSSKSRRTNATIAESASKELESLAVHMPNVSDSDARALAVRMYYIEVANVRPLQVVILFLIQPLLNFRAGGRAFSIPETVGVAYLVHYVYMHFLTRNQFSNTTINTETNVI